MARKKAEIALQQELETQEEWEEFLSKEGLSVIDVYQDWAGPCKSMISNLKRLKNELGDDLLRFAIAKSDTIDALERYRGKCEPCFMLFAGGVLVAIIRGANAPLIQRTITEQLTYEHKVIDGSAERKEIKDPLLGDLEKEKAALDEEETEKDEEEFMAFNGEMIGDADQLLVADTRHKIEQEVTVCIIKPDAIAAGKKDEILEQLAERGIEVLAQEERQLTEDETKEFYSSHAEEEYFEELVKFMSSGPSYVLVLSKGDAGIIDEFRDLLGPKDVEEAKENAPDSLRALYGTEKLTNALHASDSKDTAHAELAFFFPSFAVPTKTVAKPKKGKKKKKGKKEKAPKIERTLALIRPDALANNKEEILAKIEEAGFQVALQKEIQLTKEQAEEFYKEHVGEEYFDELTTRMSSGPLLALGLARVEAIAGWRDLLGPKEVQVAKTEAPHSLRAQYSFDEDLINPLHGSDSQTKADEELNFFFPMQQTMAVIKPDAYQTKDDIMNKIREAGFRIAARQETELNSEVVEAIYKDHKDKDYFNDLSDHMTSGPTLFMVLSRNDAVEGWRSLMGPTDPEKAKEENPECIRATFGTDIKANAVHGASDETQAQADIKLLFGEIEFNTDGEETGLENETVEQASSEEEEEEEDEEEEAGEGDEGEEQREGEEGEAQEREEGGEDAEQRPASTAVAKGEGEEQKEGEEGAEPSSEADQQQEGEQTAEGEGEQQEGEEPAKEGEGDGEEKGETETAGEKKDEGGEQGEEGAAEPAATSRPQTGQEKEEPGTLPEGDEQSPEGGEQAAEGGEQAAEGGEQAAEGGEQSPEGAEQTTEDGEKSGEGDEKPAEGERPASKTSKAASQKAEDQAGEQQQQEEEKGERPASKTSKAASQKGGDQAGEQQQQEEEEKEAPPPAEQIESGQADEQKQEQGEEKQETAAEQTEETQAEQTEETQAEQTEETQVEKTEETQAEQTEETQAEQKEETQAEQTEETQVEKTEETQAEQTEETQAEQTEETQAEQKEEETKEEPAQEQQTEGGGEEQGEQKPAEEQQQQQEGEQEAEKGGEGEQSEQKDDAPAAAGDEATDDKKGEEKKEGDETETKKE